MKYRKKPDVIEAVQITDDTFDGPHPNPDHIPGVIYDPRGRCAFIRTKVSLVRADLGDWIITEVNGEHYPCKPDIFAKTYEPVIEDRKEDAGDMTDWHCCMPGHAWDDGWCVHCGAYEPEKRIKKVEYASPQELAGFALRMVVERMAFRIDAMNERGLDGVSISKGFATEIVNACRRGAELLENPEPAKAGGGSGNYPNPVVTHRG